MNSEDIFFNIEEQLREQQDINNQIIKQLIMNLEKMNNLDMEILYLKARNANQRYEIVSLLDEGTKVFLPRFRSIDETIADIVENGKSLARFGDADFGIIFQKERENIKYQSLNAELSKRLIEVLHSRNKNLLIGIANNYGSLEEYTELAADGIRFYLTNNGMRELHEKILENDRIYEDAYISRPYVMYKDNVTDAPRKRFDELRKIWKGRNVIVVEGAHTRMGVGNDLLSGAREIKRILAPVRNAFDRYDEILHAALKYGREDTLFLIVLGSTADVLAYDLTVEGYQAVDIGQVDIEYEWYLAGKGERVPVASKYNNEVEGGENVSEFHDDIYEEQILISIT